MASLNELARHEAGLVAIGMLFQEVGKEENLQHHEDDKQFDENNSP